jgi:predicted lipoprotein with Yx(FWY)xxD motif
MYLRHVLACAAFAGLLSSGAASALDAPLAAPEGVTLQSPYFANGNGLTLYTSKADAANKSNCDAACAEKWKALAAPPKAKPSGDWTIARGFDGERQWAFRGQPVYTFADDQKIGDVKGNGAQSGAWSAVRLETIDQIKMPAGFGIQEVNDAAGRSLIDHRNMTLYAFEPGRRKQPVDRNWVPVFAGQIAAPLGDFTLHNREDGSQQWAFRGMPLYTYAEDVNPGHAKGVNVDPRFSVALVTRYFMPENAIIRHNIGYGTVVAMADGRALYMRDGFRYQVGNHHSRAASRGVPAPGRSIGTRTCDGECLKTWRPFVAPADAVPSGHWTIYTRDDGTRQWAYQGYAVYSYAGDKKAGDMTGNDTYDVAVSHDPTQLADVGTPQIGAPALYWVISEPH